MGAVPVKVKLRPFEHDRKQRRIISIRQSAENLSAVSIFNGESLNFSLSTAKKNGGSIVGTRLFRIFPGLPGFCHLLRVVGNLIPPSL